MKKLLTFIVLLMLVASFATAQAQDAPTEIGVAPPGQTSFEFIGRIEQAMFDLTAFGYVTHFTGLPSDLLFAEGTGAMFRDQTAAHFTFRASGSAIGRSNYENIFAATTTATFDVYYNETPAEPNFEDSESFATGTLVATFEGRLYSMLNVQEPNVGVLLVHADTIQTAANPFDIDGQTYQIGHVDLASRFTLFGQGFRSSTEPLGAHYHIAGDVVNFGQ
jgi:hypothetical protein